MANLTPSRLGAANGVVTTEADQRALFQKVFAGEVLTAYEQATCTLDKHKIRNIQSGKSAAFPILGKTVAAYHTPGTQLVGDSILANEIVIPIDGLLVASTSIANLDEAMAHYDVRSSYTKEMGIALANAFDQQVFIEMLKGSASADGAIVTGMKGGTTITNSAMQMTTGELIAAPTSGGSTTLAAKAAAIRDSIFLAATSLDQKNAPKERYCAVRPAEFYALFQDTTLINSLYGNGGNLATGELPQIAGIKILASNNVPYTTISSGYHQFNADRTVGIVWCPEAVGTVKLMDLSIQSEFLIEYQSTLMVARQAIGTGFLRPEAIVHLKVGAHA